MKLLVRCTLLLCMFIYGNVSAQFLSVSPSALSFGTVYETETDSLPVSITNQSTFTANISGIHFYSKYGYRAFSVADSNFSILPWQTATVYVRCHPLHNVLLNSEMLIISNAGNFSVDLSVQGKFSNTYYNSTDNLEEQSLKTAMNTLLAVGYVSLGYDNGRDAMFMTVDNKKVNGQGASVNTLECVYTGREAVGYTDRTDCQTNDNFNTEHTWPQSLFGSSEPMRSDLYHLFPTDETANNTRSNYPFGEVTSATWSNGGSSFGGGIFEPRDEHKGTVARAMFYFCIRYQNYSNFLDTQEATLRNWFAMFPPTVIDKKRNEDIALIQHNRNPFIDYPQYLNRITSVSANSVATAHTAADVPVSTIDFGYVSGLTDHYYDYHFTNYGNQNVTFTQMSFSNPAILGFAGISGADTTIAPGESLPLRVHLLSSAPQSVSEHLHVTCSAPGVGAVTIPIVANITNAVLENQPAAMLTVYPNPATRLLHINTGKNADKISFFSQNGNAVNMPYTISANDVSVDCSGIAKGSYYGTVQYKNNTATTFFRFVKN
ncbi:MAG: endonuclease [Bacteroidota bacterium]